MKRKGWAWIALTIILNGTNLYAQAEFARRVSALCTDPFAQKGLSFDTLPNTPRFSRTVERSPLFALQGKKEELPTEQYAAETTTHQPRQASGAEHLTAQSTAETTTHQPKQSAERREEHSSASNSRALAP